MRPTKLTAYLLLTLTPATCFAASYGAAVTPSTAVYICAKVGEHNYWFQHSNCHYSGDAGSLDNIYCMSTDNSDHTKYSFSQDCTASSTEYTNKATTTKLNVFEYANLDNTTLLGEFAVNTCAWGNLRLGHQYACRYYNGSNIWCDTGDDGSDCHDATIVDACDESTPVYVSGGSNASMVDGSYGRQTTHSYTTSTSACSYIFSS